LAVHEEGYRRGIRLFNERHFFDAHEVWEDVWRESTGAEKKFLQGLIQVAVAFHHHSTGNIVGARSLLERARKNLAEYPGEFGGIGLTALLDSMAAWHEAIGSGTELPQFPKIRELNHQECEVTRRKT
jgi:predicted metal-dependent hydrolase